MCRVSETIAQEVRDLLELPGKRVAVVGIAKGGVGADGHVSADAPSLWTARPRFTSASYQP